jgi:hypothetical protein
MFLGQVVRKELGQVAHQALVEQTVQSVVQVEHKAQEAQVAHEELKVHKDELVHKDSLGHKEIQAARVAQQVLTAQVARKAVQGQVAQVALKEFLVIRAVQVARQV